MLRCVIHMQDVMRLDNTARMNTPGRAEDNWMWRMGDSGVWSRLLQEAADLNKIAEMSNRLHKQG
jgi:4-alpha-glucanotransferase